MRYGMALGMVWHGAAGSDKPTKVGQRPVDDGPPLTLTEIQLAPVIWAKLSGYSWWPARVRVVIFFFFLYSVRTHPN